MAASVVKLHSSYASRCMASTKILQRQQQWDLGCGSGSSNCQAAKQPHGCKAATHHSAQTHGSDSSNGISAFVTATVKLQSSYANPGVAPKCKLASRGDSKCEAAKQLYSNKRQRTHKMQGSAAWAAVVKLQGSYVNQRGSSKVSGSKSSSSAATQLIVVTAPELPHHAASPHPERRKTPIL